MAVVVAGMVLRSWSDEGILFVFLGKLGLSPIHIDSIYNMLCEKKERVWAIFFYPLALVLLFPTLSQAERERERIF